MSVRKELLTLLGVHLLSVKRAAARSYAKKIRNKKIQDRFRMQMLARCIICPSRRLLKITPRFMLEILIYFIVGREKV